MSADRGRGDRIRVTADPATDPDAEPQGVDASAGRIEGAGRDALRVRLADGRAAIARVVPARSGSNTSPAGARRWLDVEVDGWRFRVHAEDAGRAELRERATRAGTGPAADGPIEIRTPIPGRVVSVAVAAGESVAAGQSLLVIEAMKMQNEVRAPHAGAVRRLDVAAGEAVEANDVLVVIE